MLSRIKGRIMHKRPRPHLAAGRADHAGGRPRAGRRRGERFASVGGGRPDRGSDGRPTGHGKAVEAPNRYSCQARRTPRSRSPARQRCCDRRGALYFPDLGLLVRLRPASRKGLVAGAARHARSALRHGRDAAQAAGGHRPTTGRSIVVSLGDSFHDGEGAARLPSQMPRDLSAMMAGRDWFWVAGNHDPAPPAGLPGEMVEALAVGGADLPPRAVAARRRRARSPATCIPARASCSAAARCAAAASPATDARSSCRPSAPIPARSTCSTAPMPACSAKTGLIAYMIGASRCSPFPRDAEAG